MGSSLNNLNEEIAVAPGRSVIDSELIDISDSFSTTHQFVVASWSANVRGY
jgi:hypothetical protein